MSVVVAATEENLRRAAELLAAGELVCFPTETVYGVGADASNPVAVGRIFRAKGRPADHPLIIHLPAAADLSDWAAEVPPAAIALSKRFWPGALTLVLKRGPRVPLEVTGGQETVALRVPSHPVALRLLQLFGGALAAPSANRFGRISPTRAAHAAADLGPAVAMVLDGGDTQVGLESTIIDLSGATPRLLRPGGVSRERLDRALGMDLARVEGGPGPRVPGRLASHYAPVSPAELVAPELLEVRNAAMPAASVLARRPAPAGHAGLWLCLPDEPAGFARQLYAAMRELDAAGRPILIEAPPAEPSWEAVNDRLRRAVAGGQA